MAIDSAEKRRAAAGVKRFAPGVTPNASKDREWRQQASRIYSGISPGGSQPVFLPHFRGLLRTPGKLMH